MAKDLEQYDENDRNADLTPMLGPMPYAGNSSYNASLPAWMEPVPEYGPTDGIIDTIARYWSLIIRWPRYGAVVFMWVTYTPWRFGFITGTALLVLFAIFS